MELFVLADVDWEDFWIVGIYSTLQKAKDAAAETRIMGSAFWIEKHQLDEVSNKAVFTGGCKYLPAKSHLISKDGQTWEERSY